MNSLSLALKFFIPSWRFFDQAGPFFFLDVQKEGESQWRPLFLPPKIRFQNLFSNPRGNLYLAHMNLVERFAVELGQSDSIFESIVFSQLVEMIQQNMQKENVSPRFRFQIRMCQVPPTEEQVLFLSEFLGGKS